MTLTPLIPAVIALSLLVPCQSLVTFSSAPGQRLRARPPLCVEVECGVQRTASGGLGIQVDERNAIATSDGQETLRAGDIIVAVDGVRLDGRPVATVLEPKAEYIFTVERGSASAESTLLRLTAAHAQASEEEAAEILRGIEGAATALQQDAAPVASADLLGFWRLRWASDPALAAGVTGYGEVAGCRLVASWQRLAEAEPTLQVVEVIADSNIGVHQVAARKGRWEVGGVGGSDAPALSELYSRLEYADAMVSAEPVRTDRSLAYVSGTMRVDRGADGLLLVYVKEEASTATGELQRLLATPVAGESMPRWQQADLMRRYSNGPDAEAGSVLG